jgi:predicted PurR-regulated permease PerM
LDADVASVIVPKTIYVLIGFVIGQLNRQLLFTAFIFSKSVKSHPLRNISYYHFSRILAGPIGMLLAVPILYGSKSVLSEFFSENRIVRALTKNM